MSAFGDKANLANAALGRMHAGPACARSANRIRFVARARRTRGRAMSYRNLLIILAICMGCGFSCARPGSSGPSAQDRMSQDREACEADVKRLCISSTPKPGDPTVLNCLQAHKDELTEACRKNVESHAESGGPAR
jgi:hypothetical protein